MRKTVFFANAWEEIKPKLEAADIWYKPLKGAILKDFYPKFGMREFSDYDILFDASREEEMKNIMEGLGFTTEKYDASHHDIYHKAPVLNFEMHTKLAPLGENDQVREYYSHIEDRLDQRDEATNAASLRKTDTSISLYMSTSTILAEEQGFAHS